MKAKCDEKRFIELITTIGPARTSEQLDCDVRSIYRRRRKIEERLGVKLPSPQEKSDLSEISIPTEYPQRIQATIENGVVLVGSDSHYWPDLITPAHKGFVVLCKKLKPRIVIKNGDEFDGASISRHPKIGWEGVPSVHDELEVVRKRLNEIKRAAPDADFMWPLGNHDARFETRLATVASEFEKVRGVHLQDHFPDFAPCWSVWINDEVIVKHRYKGGEHAAFNNAVKSGKTIVTGHMHRLLVRPFHDYNGVRYGVECGTLADNFGPQFVNYTEDNPTDWQSGFAVLTFKDGKLLPPELAHVYGDKIAFRGELIDV